MMSVSSWPLVGLKWRSAVFCSNYVRIIGEEGFQTLYCREVYSTYSWLVVESVSSVFGSVTFRVSVSFLSFFPLM